MKFQNSHNPNSHNHKSPFWALFIAAPICVTSCIANAQIPDVQPALENGNGVPFVLTISDFVKLDMLADQGSTLDSSQKQQQDHEVAQADETRYALTKAGVADKVTQDRVIEFQKFKSRALNREYESYKKLLVATEKRNSTDSQMATFLSVFRADLKKEDVLRQAALEEFSKQLELEQHPKLEILLMRMGITTDDRAVVVQGAPLSAALKPMQPFFEGLSK